MAFNNGSGHLAGAEDRHMFVPSVANKVVSEIRQHISPGTHQKSWVGTFMVADEDHTIGQLLRHALKKDSRVKTSGYLIPHPLEAIMKIHVQTVDSCSPRAALDDAIDRCLLDLAHLATQLQTLNTRGSQ